MEIWSLWLNKYDTPMTDVTNDAHHNLLGMYQNNDGNGTFQECPSVEITTPRPNELLTKKYTRTPLIMDKAFNIATKGKRDVYT